MPKSNINKITSKENFVVIVCLLFIPFIQLGYEFYLSFQILGVCIALNLIKVSKLDFLKYLAPLMIVYILMISHLLFYLEQDDLLHAALLVSRNFVCFFILILSLTNESQAINLNKNIINTITIIVCFLFGLSVLQLIGFRAGYNISLANEWFITNSETLVDDINIFYGLARPSATFGEPSFFCYVLLSIYLIVLIRYENGKNKLLIVLLLWASILISSSVSGFVVFFLVTIFYLWEQLSIFMLAIFTAIFAIILSFIMSENMLNRLSAIYF